MTDIPEYGYKIVADEQGERWGYTTTLDPAEYAGWIRKQAADPNLRADVQAAIRAYLRVTSR